ALAQGVRLTALASSWAAFVIHAASLLGPGGRLALVIPAELLAVNYAREVRRFLMSRFRKVGLVTFNKRIFPDVLEEVILLLAEGEGPTDHFEIYKAGNLNDLKNLEDLRCVWVPPDPYGKWTAALIEPAAAEMYVELTTSAKFTPLLTWGKTSLGMVTGNNRYFTLAAQEVAELNLRTSELLAISPPGSRHLRGLTLSSPAWDELALQDKRIYLFYPRADSPSGAAGRYIAEGEQNGVDQAYKCRVRNPWWRVPLISVPDLFFTYMNDVAPRLVENRAGVRHLNSIHGVYLREGLLGLGANLLPLAALNTVTLLGAEIVGRSYGGGILKLEPKEADLLPVPSIEVLTAASSGLRTLRPKVAALLGQGALLEAVEMVDKVLLESRIGVRTSQLGTLRKAWRTLFDRRQTRAGK
ncbi:MAG: SAM-dependent methyltransferase, partial [Actinomycetota bacterium]